MLSNASSHWTRHRALVRRGANSSTAKSEPAPAAKSFAERHPFALQLGVATCKTSAADILVQVVVDKKRWDEIDYKRNGIFVVFGFAYLGGFQYWLLVNKYAKWFPSRQRFASLSLAEKLKDTAGILDALKMVAFDVFVHLPLMYFPAYYTCKEVVTGTSWNPLDWVKVRQSRYISTAGRCRAASVAHVPALSSNSFPPRQDGCTKYWNNMDEDCLAMIKLWGPSDCIQFSMPVHISMPFRHMVSFFWTAYVSFTRGGAEEESKEEVTRLKRRLSVSGDSL